MINKTAETLLSIDERLMLMEKSKASSPKAAAAKLKYISKVPFFKMLHDVKDLDLLFTKCGLDNYNGLPETDVDYYYQAVHLFHYLYRDAKKDFPRTEESVQFVNAMYILGAMFLDKTREKDKYPDIYLALNMSLSDYWNAVIDTCIKDDGSIDWKRRNRMKKLAEKSLKNTADDRPLKEEIACILNRYMTGWFPVGRLHEVLSCDVALDEYYDIAYETVLISVGDDYDPEDFSVDEMCYCEEGYEFPEETQDSKELGEVLGEDVQDSEEDDVMEEEIVDPEFETQKLMDEYNLYMDPAGYFLDKFEKFEFPVDDFRNDNVKYVREEVLFKEDDYSKETIDKIREKIKYKCFKDKFDEVIKTDSFGAFDKKCQMAADEVFNLLVRPFLYIQRYHYEGTIEE